MEPRLEPKRLFSMCGEGCGSNSKLKEAQNESSNVAAPKVDLTWCMPDASLLKKLQFIGTGSSEEETEEMDISLPGWPVEENEEMDSSSGSSEEEGWFSEEESTEIDSSLIGSFEEETKEMRDASLPNKLQFIVTGSELDVVLWSKLCDDQLHNVIVRLPLHSLFRASSLSKQWLLKFNSVSFRHEVSEVSCSSTALGRGFCPLFMSRKVDGMVGFESSSRRWCLLPTFSYIPSEFLEFRRGNVIASCGPLLGWADKFPSRHASVLVTNPLTRSWRLLPPFPENGRNARVQMHIVCEGGSKPYKVFICTRLDRDNYKTFIFDSTDSSWTTTEFSTTRPPNWPHNMLNNIFLCCSAVINGALYKLFPLDYPGPHGGHFSFGVNCFSLKEKAWKGVSCVYQIFPDQKRKPPRPLTFNDGMCQLFVCGSKVILVTTQYDYDMQTLAMFEVDLNDGWAIEVSRAPAELLLLYHISSVESACCHGGFIYLGGNSFPWIRYNVATREWHWNQEDTDPDLMYCFWVPIAYKPGLNPWLEV